jgi:hypothetical protein
MANGSCPTLFVKNTTGTRLESADTGDVPSMTEYVQSHGKVEAEVNVLNDWTFWPLAAVFANVESGNISVR